MRLLSFKLTRAVVVLYDKGKKADGVMFVSSLLWLYADLNICFFPNAVVNVSVLSSPLDLIVLSKAGYFIYFVFPFSRSRK